MTGTMAQPQIYLLRHGETVFNTEDRFTGQLETPLTSLGRTQAAQAASEFKKIPLIPDIIYVSPLSRAIETAVILCNQMGLNPQEKIRVIPELKERNSGALSGMTRSHVRDMYGDALLNACDSDYNARPPSSLTVSDLTSPALQPALSESLQDVENRVKPFFENQLARDAAEGKKVIVIGHQNNLRPLIKLATGIEAAKAATLAIPNCKPIKIDLSQPVLVNKTAHPRVNNTRSSECATLG
jgi:2,3-bisphosphoglycerate-dependent phosphoglycerate mutase